MFKYIYKMHVLYLIKPLDLLVLMILLSILIAVANTDVAIVMLRLLVLILKCGMIGEIG